MRALRTFLSRARALGRGRRLERDLKQEIAAHLEEAAEEYVRQGLSPADARRSFGGVAQVEEQYRDVRSFVWVGHVSRDIQYAVRTLRRTPGFTAATIVTLALAIGANTVAFSVVNALVLRPLPLPGAEQLASVQPQAGTNVSFPNYRDLRDRNDGIQWPRGVPDDGDGIGNSGRLGAHLGLSRHRQLLRGSGRDAAHGPVLPSGGGPAARRKPLCRPQLRMLAEPLRRRPADRRSGNPAQRPGLHSPRRAAFANSLPLSIDQSSSSVAPDEARTSRPAAQIEATVYQVSPGYFRTMGTRLVRGREFSWQDDEKAPRVAIVNETLARKLFGRTDVVGRRFQAGQPTEVIGVARDGKYVALTESARPALFRSALQIYNGTTVLLARTSAPEAQTAADMRQLVTGADATLAVYGVGSLKQILGFAYFPARTAMTALTAFGILAIMLAAMGIYGIAAYAVSRRGREIGIRLAIGAQPRDILRVVLGRTAALLALGSIAGFALGLAAEPLLASIVYQATPYDPAVMVSVLFAMAAVALLAAAAPARRALRVDPVHALRQE
jgi:hypothetical protein